MKNKVEVKEVIIITNELGTEVFTKEGELIASLEKKVQSENVESPDYNTVANRIKKILEMRKITCSELSDITGITKGSISQMKNRKSKISRKNAIRMQKAGLGDAKAWLDLKV
jgi:hypothetical protein